MMRQNRFGLTGRLPGMVEPADDTSRSSRQRGPIARRTGSVRQGPLGRRPTRRGVRRVDATGRTAVARYWCRGEVVP